MKKVLLSLVLGFILHALYVDFIIWREVSASDKCVNPINEWYHSAEHDKMSDKQKDLKEKQLNEEINLCESTARKTVDKYKLKNFGLYRIMKYENTFLKWELE